MNQGIPLVLLLAGLAVTGAAPAGDAAEMSFDELAACMTLKRTATALEHEVDADRAALERQKQALAEEEGVLATLRQRLDGHSKTAVDDYNARVDRQDAAARDFNARIGAFNSDAAEATRQGQAYAGRCANRPFRAADVERLPAELRDVAREGAVKASAAAPADDVYARSRTNTRDGAGDRAP